MATRKSAPEPTATATAAEDEKPVPFSMRLPPAVHNQLRDIAHNERVSIHSLIIGWIEEALSKRTKKGEGA